MNPVMHSQGETVQAFNKALRSLLKQAQETWPDNKQVSKAYKKFKKIKQAYPVAPLRAFMTLVAPYEADIMTADVQLLCRECGGARCRLQVVVGGSR